MCAVADVREDSDEMMRFALRLMDHMKGCRLGREVSSQPESQCLDHVPHLLSI